MPRILALLHTLPYPPDGGVFIRTYNVLRQLSQRFDLRIHAFERANSQAIPPPDRRAHHKAIAELGELSVVPLPQGRSRVRFLLDQAASLATGRSAVAHRYRSGEYRSELARILDNGSYDLVHVDSLDLVRHLELLEGQVVACTHHNVESALLRQQATVQRLPPLGWYVEYQARLVRRDEERWCPRFAMNLTVSDQDAADLGRIAPDAHFATVPNGVDLDYMVPGRSTEQAGSGLVFVGGTGWFPNQDALEFFCDDVLPLLRGRGYDPTVRWVGRAPDELIRAYRDRQGVELTGYVDDIRPIVRRAACYVLPIRVGGGTRLKLLDAWALGKAVVSTGAGAAGTHAVNGENILLADDPEEFAAAVIRVLSEPGLRAALGTAGRRTVERYYGWDMIGRDLHDLYMELIEEGCTLAIPRAKM